MGHTWAAILAGLQFGGQALGLLAGTLAVDDHPRPHLRFKPIDPGEALIEQVERREFAAADELGGFGDGPWFGHGLIVHQPP